MHNRFAGQSLERIAAPSDGVFAIAMTLIVLEIRVPVTDAIHTGPDLWAALVALKPRFVTYMLSFLTLGIFWTGQQTQLNFFAHGDRDLGWIHFGFLAVISLLPFTTTLLSDFIELRLALLLYWLNVLIPGLVLLASWFYASCSGLLKEEVTPEISAAMKRRIVVAQALYAFGAALCLISTYWSIGFIVLVQLNYAIAPRIRWLYQRL